MIPTDDFNISTAQRMTIGEKLLKLRINAKKTREEVAKIIGVSPQAIYKYENGIVENLPLNRIEKFSKLYNVTPSFLMGWEDNPSPLSEKEKSLIFSYRAHPEMQDAIKKTSRHQQYQLNKKNMNI